MKAREELFHDDWASLINIDQVDVDEFFQACTAPENRVIVAKIGSIRDKKILELGCGAGEASVYFAKLGAQVTACDLSGGMLQTAGKLAKRNRVEIATAKCSADVLAFYDNSFDIVYAANLLHHVDIEATLVEARRVLKKGGLFVSWDPLAHNPLINVYRQKAIKVRTADEHPLKMSDLNIFNRLFSQVEYETTWLSTLLIFLKFYFLERVDPNAERYWKKIIYEHKRLERLYLALERIDHLLLRNCTFLQRYCWNVIVFAYK
jgi:ubiquinone/menaquinone biosynthesis C-methylase UbiE